MKKDENKKMFFVDFWVAARKFFCGWLQVNKAGNLGVEACRSGCEYENWREWNLGVHGISPWQAGQGRGSQGQAETLVVSVVWSWHSLRHVISFS